MTGWNIQNGNELLFFWQWLLSAMYCCYWLGNGFSYWWILKKILDDLFYDRIVTDYVTDSVMQFFSRYKFLNLWFQFRPIVYLVCWYIFVFCSSRTSSLSEAVASKATVKCAHFQFRKMAMLHKHIACNFGSTNRIFVFGQLHIG